MESLSAYSPTTWHYLTNPKGGGYHALYAPLLIGELLANLTLLMMVLLLLVVFFQKKATFPALYIAYLTFNALVQIVDLAGTQFIPSLANQMTPKDYKMLVRSVIGGCIWISYALVSKRVKATFIR